MTPTCLPPGDYAGEAIDSTEVVAPAPIVAPERISISTRPMGIQPANYVTLTGQSSVPQNQIEIADPLENVSSVSGHEPYDYFAQ